MKLRPVTNLAGPVPFPKPKPTARSLNRLITRFGLRRDRAKALLGIAEKWDSHHLLRVVQNSKL
jgi:hypothetical protein